jgi:hypothetical protein
MQECDGKRFAFQQLSTLLQFSMLNLKNFLKVNPLAEPGALILKAPITFTCCRKELGGYKIRVIQKALTLIVLLETSVYKIVDIVQNRRISALLQVLETKW